jgi:preprotein translocase subunit SecY
MLQAFLNIWRIADLRAKMIFTLAMLAVYRVGFWIPLPGVSQEKINARFSQSEGGAAGNLLSYMSTFTGGSFSQSTIFSLGIMPYISAAIIFQLLGTFVPSLKEMKKDAGGNQKIMEYTRYATIGICVIQAIAWLATLQSQQIVLADWNGTAIFWIAGITCLTAGTTFLMWLGEMIDQKGIGNGVSLIITAGIVAQMPNAIQMVISQFSFAGTDASKNIGPTEVLILISAFIIVVAGAIAITQGQRRIPIQQAKHTRGRRVYGGQKSYLPLRVNHGGVMPIIFASSIMIFPSIIVAAFLQQWPDNRVIGFLSTHLNQQGYLYLMIYIGLIYFFAYFWTTVQFQPNEMATQLRDGNSFVPGLRPGPRTAEYLEAVMERITFVGAGFLALIAVVPALVSGQLQIDPFIASFLGGTGLLIVVSVMLDFVQRIEAALLMRNYQGFLSKGGSGRGPRIRGSRN